MAHLPSPHPEPSRVDFLSARDLTADELRPYKLVVLPYPILMLSNEAKAIELDELCRFPQRKRAESNFVTAANGPLEELRVLAIELAIRGHPA